MTRPQMLTGDIESSDSEREDYDRSTPKRADSHVRSTPKTLTQGIRKSPRGSGRTWRSSLLKWNVQQAGDPEEALPDTDERTMGDSLSYRPITERNGRRSKGELPLSDPRSWVWKGEKHAKFAVAIDATKGIFPDVFRHREHVRNIIGQHDEGTDLAPEKPKERLWLDRVESTYLVSIRAFLVLTYPLSEKCILPY
jgi:hypothetical protein